MILFLNHQSLWKQYSFSSPFSPRCPKNSFFISSLAILPECVLVLTILRYFVYFHYVVSNLLKEISLELQFYLFCPFALVSFFRTHFPCSLSFVHTQYVSLFLKSFLPFIYDLQKKFFLPSIFKGLLKNGLFVLVHSSLVSMSEITFIYNSFPEWCHFI